MVSLVNDKDTYVEDSQEFELSLLQSWEWGELKRPSWTPLRLKVDNYPITVLLKRLPIFNKQFGYIPRAFRSSQISKSKLQQLEKYLLDETRLSHVLLEPDSSNQQLIKTFQNSGWVESGHTIQPQNSNIIKLDEGEEAVFARMSGNYRKKIRRAVKHGCEVEVLTYDNDKNAVDRFFKIMDEIYHRTKFIMSGKDYFEKIWKEFGPIGKAKILLVKYNGNDVGSIMYLYDENVAYELYGGTGQSGRSIMANYLLKWEGIKHAIELGKKSYDQWGVAPKVDGVYEHKHPLSRISEFKAGFGGEDVEYLPQFVKVFNPLTYFYYRVGLFVSRLKLKLKKL